MLYYPGEYIVITRVIIRERGRQLVRVTVIYFEESQLSTTGFENGSGTDSRNFKASKNFKNIRKWTHPLKGSQPC